MDDLLKLLPGYDPFRDAGGCHFDEGAARLALDFFPRYLRHVEGTFAGKPFGLEPWQRSFIANLFGWMRGDARRYREALLYVPRKNGKTPLAAGICLYGLLCDREAGAQIFSAAAEREQAALLFRHARGMVEGHPSLDRRCRVYGGLGHRSIVLNDDQTSAYKVLSADAPTKHGLNASMAVIDELHAQPNRHLVDTLQTAMASAGRRQPLLLSITTADFHRPSICNEKHDYACKVRDGILADPSFLPAIYETQPEEDWTNPKVWARANPNLGVSVSLEYLERECQRARETPAYENTFRRLHLNQKTETDVRAIPMGLWDTCLVEPWPNLTGAECVAGLDLSSTTDLTAWVEAYRLHDGVAVVPHFWAPAETARLRERRDRVPYELWARQGYLTLTPGNVVDYDRVRADINRFAGQRHIREVAADRWNATQLITQLMGDGLQVVAFGQGFKDMTAPTKELLRLVADGKLRHGNHPILRWMASNLSTETDAAGNLKPSKKKSTERIDGIVALIMALGRLLVQPETSIVVL